MTMRKFNFVALFLISVGFATTVQAHAMLDHASPPVGSTVGSSPGQVTLYFTQQLEPKFSGAEVRNASGARVDKGKSISGNVMRVSIGALPAGGVHGHVACALRRYAHH